MNIFETTALLATGVARCSTTAKAAQSRASIFEMTQAAENAVLRPKDTGPWSHALRAALAARIARLNGEDALAERHRMAAGEYAPMADLDNDGEAQGFGAVVTFTDKVAEATRAVEVADILALQTAGVADADIVRLAELNAFLAYQLRVIAGLRLIGMGG